jgi:hypothetical protein
MVHGASAVGLSAGDPLWPRFDDGTARVLSLDTPTPAVENNFAATHSCSFWQGIS